MRIRTELESAIGKAIHFKARQIEDITSSKLRSGQDDLPGLPEKKKTDSQLENSPELAAAMQRHIEALYQDWADEPLPAFKNRTPKEMLGIRGGEKQVRRLIRTYESSAARQSLDGRGPMLSFSFLYEKLGLSPDRGME